MVLVETVVTSVVDQIAVCRDIGRGGRVLVLLVVVVIFFLLSLPYTCNVSKRDEREG